MSETTLSLSKSDADQEFANIRDQFSLLSPLSSFTSYSRPAASLFLPLSLSSLLSFSPPRHQSVLPLSLSPRELTDLPFSPQSSLSSQNETYPNLLSAPTDATAGSEIWPSAASSIRRPRANLLPYKNPSFPSSFSLLRSEKSVRKSLFLTPPPAATTPPPTATTSPPPAEQPPFASSRRPPPLLPPANSIKPPFFLYSEPHKPRRTSIVRYVYLPGLPTFAGGDAGRLPKLIIIIINKLNKDNDTDAYSQRRK